MDHDSRPDHPDVEHLSARPVPERSTPSDQRRLRAVSPDLTDRRRASCPLIRAAARSGDPVIVAAVARLHPISLCPAAQRRAS
jgi:hypothetical protein